MSQKAKTVCIACSIFKSELERLIKIEKFNIDAHYVTSMLHMKPEELDKKLAAQIKKYRDSRKILLLFGECSPFIDRLSETEKVMRPTGLNCIEILLGAKRYKQFIADGVFFLMPEWTMRWEEVFKFELGLSGEVAKEFMREYHKKLIYLDTGQISVPHDTLREIEQFTGLEAEVLEVSTENLEQKLSELLPEFQ